MEYKLLALDLDGTLLNEEHQLSPEIIRAIRELIDKGFHVTLATNRMFQSAESFAKLLNIDLPLIVYGGSLVKCPKTKDEFLDLRISRNIALKAIELMKDEPSTDFLFQEDEIYTSTKSIYTDRYQSILGIELKIVPDFREVLIDRPRTLVFYVKLEEVERLTQKLKAELESVAQVVNSAPYFIDVTHLEATKGKGLESLAEKLHIKRDEIIAVGDGMNDIEMIDYAGLGVAVANASKELKDRADYITKEEREKGVLEVVKKFICNESL